MEEILKHLRILVVSQYFWPENFRINDWVDGMVELGHEVTVLSSLPNYPEGILKVAYKNNPEKYTKYKGVEIIRVPQILRGSSSLSLFLNYISFAFFGSTLGVWKLRKKKFDVTFVFAVSPILMVIPAIMVKITKNVPILLWVLDLWPDVLKAMNIVNSKFLLYVLNRFVAFLYLRCDCVVAQSSMFLKDIKKLVPNHANVDFIPSWGEQICHINDKHIENLILEKRGKFNIFYTGNIGEAQDFQTVIDAAKQLKTEKEIKWFIVGNGRMAEWLRNQIVINDLQDSFYILGSYPIEKMAVFFKYANAGLLCLKNDEMLCKTIPGKLQTYFSYSIPVIGACDGEVNKIVNENKAGLVGNAGDSYQLARNVILMKNLNSKDMNEMSFNANKYYINNFDRNLVMLSFENKLLSLTK